MSEMEGLLDEVDSANLGGAYGQLRKTVSPLWSAHIGEQYLATRILVYTKEGVWPQSSGPGHGVGVLGTSFLPKRSWAGRVGRLGGIAELTLTSSIKPHFMEPAPLWH